MLEHIKQSELITSCACIWQLMSETPYQLTEIIAPGQEENLGVVFLPVRQNEAQHDSCDDEVDPEYPYPILSSPKYGVQSHW